MVRVPGFIKRGPRIDLRRPAVLINSDGVAVDVILLDLSSTGFKIEVADAPRIGEMVTLRDEKSGDLRAQIRWQLGDQAGGVFLVPIDHPEK